MDSKVNFTHVNVVGINADTDMGENISITFDLNVNTQNGQSGQMFVDYLNSLSLDRSQVKWDNDTGKIEYIQTITVDDEI